MVPSEPKKRDFFPAKNPVDARQEVVNLLSLSPIFLRFGLSQSENRSHNDMSFPAIPNMPGDKSGSGSGHATTRARPRTISNV